MTEAEEQAKYYKDKKEEEKAVENFFTTPNDDDIPDEPLRMFASSRPILPERWDLIPASALREVAEIMYRGQDKHPQDNWREVDFNSEQSSLNRAIAHAYRASEMAPHSTERTQQLAKATCRLLMQIWWELQKGENDEDNS